MQSNVYSDTFFSTLFALEPGEISEPIVLDNSVGIFELIDQREASEEDLDFLSSYYSYIYDQNLDQDLNDFIFSSPKLVDNFSEVFTELFLSP